MSEVNNMGEWSERTHIPCGCHPETCCHFGGVRALSQEEIKERVKIEIESGKVWRIHVKKMKKELSENEYRDWMNEVNNIG